VDGDNVTGNGMTFFQFILPLERSAALSAPEADDHASTDGVERANSPASANPPAQKPNAPLLNPLD
jgi:hypothetical protein